MTTITLETPLTKFSKTKFKNEKELITYFLNVLNVDSINFHELDFSQLDDELLQLVNTSRKKSISEFDNI